MVLVVLSLLFSELFYTLILFIMVLSFGTALAFGPLNRAAIDNCQEPMGRRMAIFSTYMNAFGVIATLLVTLFNNNTMGNLSILMAMGVILAFIAFMLMGKKSHST
jgi:DHA1 family multidrug/chloramphenicol efflux transport protein-like MFS transporter